MPVPHYLRRAGGIFSFRDPPTSTLADGDSDCDDPSGTTGAASDRLNASNSLAVTPSESAVGRPAGYPSPHYRHCKFPGRCQHWHSVGQRSAAIDPSNRRRYRSDPLRRRAAAGNRNNPTRRWIMRRYALAVLALRLALPVTAFAEERHACCAKGGACDAAKGASGCETKACKAKACEGKACDSATCPSAGRAHA